MADGYGGWVIPWRVYVDQRFESTAKLNDEREKASRRALGLLSEKYEAQHAALLIRIDAVQRSQDQAEGRRTVLTVVVAAGVSVIVGATVGLIVGVLLFLIHH